MLRNIAIAVLLFGGLYLPTSSNAVISNTYLMISAAILYVILFILFIKKRKLNLSQLFFAIGINMSLLIATLITPFADIKYGSAAFYFLLSFLFCLDLKDIELTKGTQKLFFVANIINLFLGFAILFQNQIVTDFIKQHYAAFYDDLVPNMLLFQKPVLTFASHSLAGFFLYLFFFANFQTYKTKKKFIYFIFSLAYIGLLICLKSNTAFLFVGIAVIQTFSYLFVHKRALTYLIVITSMFLFAIYFEQISMFYKVASMTTNQTLHSSNNGLLGRYSSSGNLADNLNYIAEHPFRPIGFGYSPDLFYGDSGMIEYITRGSVLLLICMYGGLFLFLKRNLYSKKVAYSLFCLIILFEVGFTGLTYFRTVYLLPFIVIYLNTLEKQKEQRISPSKVLKKKKKKIKIRWSA